MLTADRSEQCSLCLFGILGVQLVLAGSEGGLIILWDLRGGRSSAAFVRPGEVYEVHEFFRQKLVMYLRLKESESIRTQFKLGVGLKR